MVSVYHVVVIGAGLASAIVGQVERASLEPAFSIGLVVVGFGAIGGALSASRSVIYAVRHRKYDRARLLWQVLTPLHGATLGGVATLIIQGGVLASTTTAPSTSEASYRLFVASLGFLAGFASEVLVKRLIGAAEALFGENNTLKRSVTGEDDSI